ncbi:hypothetical protein B5P19_11625 [Clavibacter sepedonicus]|nr:hypothetical protein B5P19_11625 [Clavibacter sepedonicus]OQJ54368.1 hypothetical protein B5P20_09810 [Clavibacter sepedonicus]
MATCAWLSPFATHGWMCWPPTTTPSVATDASWSAVILPLFTSCSNVPLRRDEATADCSRWAGAAWAASPEPSPKSATAVTVTAAASRRTDGRKWAGAVGDARDMPDLPYRGATIAPRAR